LTGTVDLRRVPLAEIRALDLRPRERDLWADEAALWDREVSVVAWATRRSAVTWGWVGHVGSWYEEAAQALERFLSDRTYENLTGHVRSHLAMIASWGVRATWPGGPDGGR
jgi:hypothetical protein